MSYPISCANEALIKRIFHAFEAQEVHTAASMAEVLNVDIERIRNIFMRMMAKDLLERVSHKVKGSKYKLVEGAEPPTRIVKTQGPVEIPQHDELHQLFFSKGDYHERARSESH